MSVSEKAFRSQVVNLAESLGWRCFYVDQSTRFSEAAGRRVRNINLRGQGFPDLVMVRRRDARLLFAELKRDRGPRGGGVHTHVELGPEQRAWITDLEEVAMIDDRIAVRVWRPSDFDAITETLR